MTSFFSKKSLAIMALLEVSLFWGLCWVGYRQLHAFGMSGMAAGVSTSIVAAIVAGCVAWRALREGGWRGVSLPILFLLMASSAISALGFTWGMVHGEVMRVMLLFYLMPVWTVILAHLILKEKANWAGWLGVGLGLLGAALMLYDPALGAPWPASPAEWAGLAAGMGSGVLNVLVKKTPDMRSDARAFFLSVGGVILGLLWLPFEAGPHLPRVDNMWWAVVVMLVMGCLLLFTNRMYQYGVRHLTSHQVVVILPFELVVGAMSSWLIADEVLSVRAWIGGVLILSAGVVSAWWSDGH